MTEEGAQELTEATERWVHVRQIIDSLLLQDGSE